MQVELNSGREIHLRELRQTLVYEGILEGVPTQDDNRHLVADVVAEAARQFKTTPTLIEPDEEILDRPPTRRGVPATIPSVACVGRFLSFQPARDSKMGGAELVVVWFQDEFGLPDSRFVERLKLLDWDAIATDFEW